MFLFRCAVASAAMVVLQGCFMVGPDYVRPEAEVAESWSSAAADPRLGNIPANPPDWWTTFNDPVLTKVVEAAVGQNLTLQQMGLRVMRARLGKLTALELLAPAIVGSGSIARSYYSTNVKPGVEVSQPQLSVTKPGVFVDRRFPNLKIPVPDISVTPPEVSVTKPEVSITDHIDVFDVGFDAIWELDLWGKKRRIIQSANATFEASIADYDGAVVSLAAEAAATYVRIRATEEKLALARANVATVGKVLAAAEEQVKKGKPAQVDVKLTRAVLADVSQLVPLLEAALKQFENDLCVLLGRPPHDVRDLLGGAGTIPAAPTEIALGIPADLLRRRPDIRAAERLAAAQSAQIGAAAGNAYPSFSLVGGVGFTSSDAATWFTGDSLRGVMGGLVKWNILLYPFIVQRVRVQDVQFQEQITIYQDTVLQAAREVENSIVAYLKTLDRVPLLAGGAASAQEALNLSLKLYPDGGVPFATVVQAVQYTTDQRQRLIDLRSEAILGRIAIYKALGGGWEAYVGRDVVSDKNKEQLRSRADWWSFWGPTQLNVKNESQGLEKPAAKP